MDNAEEYVDLMFDFCMHTVFRNRWKPSEVTSRVFSLTLLLL